MADHANIAAALVAALADLCVVEKTRTVDAGTYTYGYAELEGVVKLTRPVLASHGLVALTPLHDHGSGLAVSVILLHTSGERIDLGPFPFPPGKNAQATGSMVTYHRRYALVAALGMAAGDDDDGAAAVPRDDRQQAAEPPLSAALVERADLLPDDLKSKLLERLAPMAGKKSVTIDELALWPQSFTDAVERTVAAAEKKAAEQEVAA